MFIDRKMDQGVVVYIYTAEQYTAIRKKAHTSCNMWMVLEGIMQSEISQTEKDKYNMVSLIRSTYIFKKYLSPTTFLYFLGPLLGLFVCFRERAHM